MAFSRGHLTDSERQANQFQRIFIDMALAKYGSQDRLANALLIGQQTISKYRDGSVQLPLHRAIRIAKLIGENQIVISWS